VLLFAQLTGLVSLREIEQATVALNPTQRDSGLVPVRRSTLAEANLRVPWRFFQELFFRLLTLWKHQAGRHTFPLPGKLFSLDSTTILLCLAKYPWATFRTRKGALKLHTLLDHDDLTPAAVVVTEGKVHDIRVGRALQFRPGETVLFDRGYFDSNWMDRLCRDKVFFVTRIKGKVGFEGTPQPVDPKTGILSDWIGHLMGKPGERCRCTLRLVRYRDPETKKEFEFLTNLLDVDAATIAELYKQRWQIELFFKWIKQHLKIKTFLGTGENAVMSQIWVAMIAYLLVRTLQKQASGKITDHQLLIFIATWAIQMIPLSQAWQGFQRTKRKRTIQQKQPARKLP